MEPVVAPGQCWYLGRPDGVRLCGLLPDQDYRFIDPVRPPTRLNASLSGTTSTEK
jgi:hypothetical protein